MWDNFRKSVLEKEQSIEKDVGEDVMVRRFKKRGSRGTNHIGRSVFIHVVNTFKRSQLESRVCVGYMVAILVTGNLQNVVNIIQTQIEDFLKQRELKALISHTQGFLK